MSGVITAYSTNLNVNDAVKDIKNQIGSLDANLILFFASSNFDPNEISRKMKEAFVNAGVFGCSTAGELVDDKVLKNSIVAMAFNSNVIGDYKVEVSANAGDEENIARVFKSFEEYYGTPMLEMNLEEYVGIVLTDGLDASQERLMQKIGFLTDITFIGGSAGDDLKFKTTYVYANGEAYTGATVLVLLKPAKGFDIIKTQSFNITDQKLSVTKANAMNREVLEFNNKPATYAYAEVLGVPVADVEKYFMSNPVGLIIDREPYVRSPQQIIGDTMVFYCNVLEGMELSLLESTDIIKDTKNAVESKLAEVESAVAILNFHCILRTLELEAKNQTEEYGKIFSKVPTIGFSTYGENYLGHINQTSTMLIFK
ncbi:MAG: hypothetical protein JM58_05815 [Peptococcaceae bacterium BICA1-8]|nr:MAG: hypothetical protein JM58_05815 [Peptococcaceae bacterium BICA1-8]